MKFEVPGPPLPTPGAQLGTGVRDHCANKGVLVLVVIEAPNAYGVPEPLAAVFQPVNSYPWFVNPVASGSAVAVLFTTINAFFVPVAPFALNIKAELPAGIAK